MDKYGSLIRYAREKANMTQEELADKVGITQKTISKYESGLDIPRVNVLELIANALDCSVMSLIKG